MTDDLTHPTSEQRADSLLDQLTQTRRELADSKDRVTTLRAENTALRGRLDELESVEVARTGGQVAPGAGLPHRDGIEYRG